MGRVRALNRRRWALVRREVFERDGYRCVRCGRAGRLECDHIVPLVHHGSAYETSNLQTLCRGCHIAKTRKEKQAKKSRSVVDWENGWKSLLEETTE